MVSQPRLRVYVFETTSLDVDVRNTPTDLYSYFAESALRPRDADNTQAKQQYSHRGVLIFLLRSWCGVCRVPFQLYGDIRGCRSRVRHTLAQHGIACHREQHSSILNSKARGCARASSGTERLDDCEDTLGPRTTLRYEAQRRAVALSCDVVSVYRHDSEVRGHRTTT